MRHRKRNATLGRNTSEKKKALLRSLLDALFLNEKIKTTFLRAKALQGLVDGLICKVKKKDTMNAIREIKKIAFTKEAAKKVLKISKTFKNKSSGFTKIIPLYFRSGDNAKIVQVEFSKED